MNNPSFSRDTAEVSVIEAFFVAYWQYVLTYERRQLVFPAGTPARLLERPCPICGQRYLTSTSERMALCSDCPMDARAARDRLQAAARRREAELADHRAWAWSQCMMGERGACEHARGFCCVVEADARYAAEKRAVSAPLVG